MDLTKVKMETQKLNSSFTELLKDIEQRVKVVSINFESFKKSNEIMINELNIEFQEKLLKSLDDLKYAQQKANNQLVKEIVHNDKIIDTYKKFQTIESDIVRLNVGGTMFSTFKSTLTKKIEKPFTLSYYEPHLLEGLVNGFVRSKFDENKALFIDRDPKYFALILNYLRDANTEIGFNFPENLDLKELVKEAKYYNMIGLIDAIYSKIPFDSRILVDNKRIEFFNLCAFDFNTKWKLLYRASNDGFSANVFHLKCDNYSKTLTIVKTTLNHIFGGYTEAAWDQSGTYKADNNAFVFSLINKPVKLNFRPNNGYHTIYCRADYGPTFGGGYDFHICNNSNTCNSSYSNLGFSFPHLAYAYGSKEAQNFLAGSYNFQVADIEVFQQIS